MKKFALTSTASMRKGFTLVELLIVIVVIGILSAMMMFASSEYISTAKVTVIISNMQTLKKAALAFFADNFDEYLLKTKGSEKNQGEIPIKELLAYLSAQDIPEGNCYKIIPSRDAKTTTNGDVAWYVECSLSGTNNSNFIYKNVNSRECIAVKNKLAKRAKSVGLLADRYKPSDKNKKPYTADGSAANDKNGAYVFMLVQ